MAAVPGGGGRREAAPALPALPRADLRGRGSGGDGHGVTRRLEREGQAGARLDAQVCELAKGLRGGLRVDGAAASRCDVVDGEWKAARARGRWRQELSR